MENSEVVLTIITLGSLVFALVILVTIWTLVWPVFGLRIHEWIFNIGSNVHDVKFGEDEFAEKEMDHFTIFTKRYKFEFRDSMEFQRNMGHLKITKTRLLRKKDRRPASTFIKTAEGHQLSAIRNNSRHGEKIYRVSIDAENALMRWVLRAAINRVAHSERVKMENL